MSWPRQAPVVRVAAMLAATRTRADVEVTARRLRLLGWRRGERYHRRRQNESLAFGRALRRRRQRQDIFQPDYFIPRLGQLALDLLQILAHEEQRVFGFLARLAFGVDETF